MTEYMETEEHAGLTIGIWSEQYIEEWMSPRSEDDGLLGVMFCDYSGYTLGDKDAPDPRDQTITCGACGGTGEGDKAHEIINIAGYGSTRLKGRFDTLAAAEKYIELNQPEGELWRAEPEECEQCEGRGEVEVGIVDYLVKEHGARVVLPLFVYEHSGITMSCGSNLVTGSDNFDRRGRYAMDGAGWDTSSVGVIFDTAESRERCGWETGRTDEEIEKDLAEEVRYYAAYLENMVFGYDVIAAKEIDGQLYDVQSMEPIDSLDEAETLESCGGFLDPDAWSPAKSYVYAEARDMAEFCIARVEREKLEAHRWACADVVTV